MCNQSIEVGDLVDLVELQNDKSFENLNYLHGLVTEICPNNLLKISVGDNIVISVNRDKIQKWVRAPTPATVSNNSQKAQSKKKSTRLPKLAGLDAECAALVNKSTANKNQKRSPASGLNE